MLPLRDIFLETAFSLAWRSFCGGTSNFGMGDLSHYRGEMSSVEWLSHWYGRRSVVVSSALVHQKYGVANEIASFQKQYLTGMDVILR